MSDREWLYYGVPVDIICNGHRNWKPRARFWRFMEGGYSALLVTFDGHSKPRLALASVEHIRISQRPSDPPPMPEWCEGTE